MSAHVDVDGDCPLAVVPCQYTDIGCKFKVRCALLLRSAQLQFKCLRLL